MPAATIVVVPQVNVNDESVLLVRWTMAPATQVTAGDLICEVETTKAVAEVNAPVSGWLVQSACVGDRIAVGGRLGAIGPTLEAATTALAVKPAERAAGGGVAATPKARALAEQQGVSLDDVLRGGVTGTIKESDVQRFLAVRPSTLPAGLSKYVEPQGPLPAFESAVAASLRRSTQQLILTSVDMDCGIAQAQAAIDLAKAAGRMVSLLHVIIGATARVLPQFPRLTSVVHDGTLYRYRALDVGFVVRAADGRLFTPVVRAADQLTVEEIAKTAQAAALRVMRGSAKVDDLEGAAFTISQVAVPGTTRVVPLPSVGQSAILGVSAERPVLSLDHGSVVARPTVTLTLNYDHTVCDGIYAANFLSALVQAVQTPTA